MIASDQTSGLDFALMADAPSGDLRDAILAELSAAPAEAAAPVVEAPAVAVGEEAETASQDEAVEEIEAAGDEEAASEEVEQTEDESVDEDEFVLKSDDPKEQKLLDNVRRAEKRMRESAQRRDAEFAERQKEWQAKIDRAAEIDKLGARIKYDPIAILKAFGVESDDFELIAQSIYAESPALASDPKQKAAAQAKLREREKEDKLTKLERELQETKKQIEQQAANARAQAEAAAYVQQINATAAAKFPLVAQMLKADPENTNDALVATFNTLGTKLNRAPKPAEVVAEYDRRERARLTKLGIDPSTIAKTPAKKPAANGNAQAAKPAPGKPVVNGSAVKPPVDEREAILAELAAAKAAEAIA